MSKFSFSLEDKGIGGWLARNIEKKALTVAGLIFAALFTFGFLSESLEPSKTPAALVKKVKSTDQHINRDSWDEMERKAQYNHLTKAILSRAKTPASEYKTSPLFPPLFPLDQKRSDPRILPPTDIQVAVTHGPLLLRPYKNYKDPLINTVPPEIEPEKKVKKKKKKKPANSNFGGEGYPGGYPGEYPGEGEGEEAPGYDPEGIAGATSKYVTLSPLQIAAFQAESTSGLSQDTGYGDGSYGAAPGMAEGIGGGPGAGFSEGATGQVSGAYYGANVVAIKGLIPHELQKAEYEAAFANAVGFNAMRDRPLYIRMEVQRADVTDVDLPADWQEKGIDEALWEELTDTIQEYRTSNRYGTIPPELADPRYILPNILTFPVPPLLLTDVSNLYLHERIPQRSSRATTEDESGEGSDPTDPPTGDPDGLPGGGLPGEGGIRNPEAGPGNFGEGGNGGLGNLPPELALASGGQYGEGGMNEGEGGGPGFGYGYSEGGAGAGFTAEELDSAEFKMIRFFDYKVKPNKKYVYRIRIRMLDPNSPYIPPQLLSGAGSMGEGAGATEGAPGGSFSFGGGQSQTSHSGILPDRMLNDEVIERLRAVKAEDEDRNKDAAEKQLTYWRYSPWSSPSEIAVIPDRAEKMWAGPTTAPKEIPINYNEGLYMTRGEHETEMAAMVWDKQRAVNVPGKLKVKRGAFLNFTKSADVVHPIRMIVRRIPEYQFDLNGIVLDVRGGEPLPGYSQKDPVLTAPGEMLLINSKGELIASEETSAAEEYKKWMLQEDKPELPTGDPYGGFDGEGGPPGEGPGESFPNTFTCE